MRSQFLGRFVYGHSGSIGRELKTDALGSLDSHCPVVHVVFNRADGLGVRRETGAPAMELMVRDAECCMVDTAHSGETAANPRHDSNIDACPHSLSMHRVAIDISIFGNDIQPQGRGEKSRPLSAGFCPDGDAMQPANGSLDGNRAPRWCVPGRGSRIDDQCEHEPIRVAEGQRAHTVALVVTISRNVVARESIVPVLQ